MVPRFRSLPRFEFEQGAVRVLLHLHVNDRREILPVVQLAVVQLGVVDAAVAGAVARVPAVLEPGLNLVGGGRAAALRDRR